MKKILVLITALMIGLSSTFACESIKDNNIDIKVCDVELFEEIDKKIRVLKKVPDANQKEIAHLTGERGTLKTKIRSDEIYVPFEVINNSFLDREQKALLGIAIIIIGIIGCNIFKYKPGKENKNDI